MDDQTAKNSLLQEYEGDLSLHEYYEIMNLKDFMDLDYFRSRQYKGERKYSKGRNYSMFNLVISNLVLRYVKKYKSVNYAFCDPIIMNMNS